MSGHSHYATIKRKKESTDAAKGKTFSKHSKAIQVAIKTGGSADPDKNTKLRFTIDQAKTDNMPKANIDRILAKANEVGNINEVTYEGYGTNGIGVVVNTATDNRNRTSQEIKNIFERGGGSLAGPGAVSFNFESKGLIILEIKGDVDDQMLALIDLGVDDIEEQEDALEVYVTQETLSSTKEELEKAGFTVRSISLVQKPKSYVTISDKKSAEKAIKFLNLLEENDDVQSVFTNLDIPQEVLGSINS